MAGVYNDYLIYPILELIKKEVRKNSNEMTDPFMGEPVVTLYRKHPLDSEKVTSVDLNYESGFLVTVDLKFGSDDESAFPDGVDSSHADYEYYRLWRLNEVYVSSFTPEKNPVSIYNVRLVYDSRGFLTGTELIRME